MTHLQNWQHSAGLDHRASSRNRHCGADLRHKDDRLSRSFPPQTEPHCLPAHRPDRPSDSGFGWPEGGAGWFALIPKRSRIERLSTCDRDRFDCDHRRVALAPVRREAAMDETAVMSVTRKIRANVLFFIPNRLPNIIPDQDAVTGCGFAQGAQGGRVVVGSDRRNTVRRSLGQQRNDDGVAYAQAPTSQVRTFSWYLFRSFDLGAVLQPALVAQTALASQTSTSSK